MARKRIEAAALKSWDEVSGALARIGGVEREITTIEVAMQAKIDAAKAEAAQACRPLNEEKARMEAQIAAFADAHREGLGDRKSKTLYFGSVGYRKSSRVILPKAANKLAEIVIRLRSRGMNECVVSRPETVDREALKKYPENEILEVGARLEVKDTFWYEVNRDRLCEK